ncbi:MAG: C45 family autoproteolytic acyltransferase/hydrolase [bacterium]|nr:C45 family autoproteolytic acyltransferase/hydrolase [bacterium]
MRRPPIRMLDVGGSPAEMGYVHGGTYAAEIREYSEERIGLVMAGLWTGVSVSRGMVLELAEACLEAHEQQSAVLYEEMSAMAGGAGISLAEAVVVGGFTDFVDTVRAHLGDEAATPLRVEDDCTAFIVPDDRAGGAGFFGQTWDMHASATDHVILVRTRPEDGPRALIFTTVGCLGQIGMNEHGVCVGITNLAASDGKIGVTWPTVVRHALLADTATKARDVILDADLAGGHNYMIFDADGVGFNIEAMPSVRPVTTLSSEPLTYTNHTTHGSTRAVEVERPPDLQDSSHRRRSVAIDHLDRDDLDEGDLMDLTRHGVCQVPEPPYEIETSGATVMRPRTRDFWAVWGLPSMNDYVPIEFL